MAKKVVANAWGFNEDTENLFPGRPLLEELEDASSGAMDVQPRKILRDRQYGPQPLMVRPEYRGDFLDKLREQYKNRCADSLLDFSSPEDLTKYLPEVQVRDLQDEFYAINTPGEGGGKELLKDYNNRGWDEEDSPEMSEDKILRMKNWNQHHKHESPSNPALIFHSAAERVVNAFIIQDDDCPHQVQSVIAKFLMELVPVEIELNQQQIRVAKLLSDFKSSFYSKSKGVHETDKGGVSVSLYKEEPRLGRWTFMTETSGSPINKRRDPRRRPPYTTIFQFIPDKNIRDVNRLNCRVSCTCPSWLFYGAQYHAVMEDYLYGKVFPKFAPPAPSKSNFLVCKHVLACIPLLARKEVLPMVGIVKKKLRAPVKEYEVEKIDTGEEIRIPQALQYIEDSPEVKEAVRLWPRMGTAKRKNFIMGLETPDAVAFFAHKFPDTATQFVINKLKDMRNKEKSFKLKAHEEELLREII
jgi:hypothetical protein